MPIEPVWQKKSIGLQLLKGEGDGMPTLLIATTLNSVVLIACLS